MANKYYQKHKERLRKEARERYQNLSVEENVKRRKKARERSKFYPRRERKKTSILHGSKKKLPVYRRNYYLTLKGNY